MKQDSCKLSLIHLRICKNCQYEHIPISEIIHELGCVCMCTHMCKASISQVLMVFHKMGSVENVWKIGSTKL